MNKPKLLDLYSGAGGCARGYQQAGFYVVGVDIKHQPRYVGEKFYQADALEFLSRLIETDEIEEYDLIHASPPCQKYTAMGNVWKDREYPDLISQTRAMLKHSGRPWVIENVVGAPLDYFVTLCGATFGLKVYRHRLFETSCLLLAPPHIPHRDSTPKAGRGPSPKGFWSVAGRGGGYGTKEGWARAMGIDWMTLQEIAQAIPPKYTEWIGKQMLEMMRVEAK